MYYGNYYFLLFFVMSVLGWMMEVTVQIIESKKLVNRGFLIGPYCPIYGCGAVLITWLLSNYANAPVQTFFLAVLICGLLEYATSYVMEKLFHARWWDYSSKKFNLHGRICADTLIPFGLMGLALVYVAKPFLFVQFARIPQPALDILCWGLFILMATDTLISANVLGTICKTANMTSGDNTETITRKVRETLSQRGILIRRTLQAYPHARIYNRKLLQRLKQKKEQIKIDIHEKTQQVRQKVSKR